MSRTLAYVLGPELAWLSMAVLTRVIIWLYQPLPPNDHDKLLNAGWFLPLVGMLLALAPLLWGPGNQWWWLGRVMLASLIGIVVIVSFLCDASRYNDSRDSGIGTAFALFVGLGWMILIALVVVAALALIAQWPLTTVYKWILIVAGSICAFIWAMNWLSSLPPGRTS
ncbi:hypothetical protein [Spirosoma koreense]